MNKTRNFWDRSADSYEREVNRDNPVEAALLELTRKYLGTDSMVLDLGCAAGGYAIEFAPQVKEFHGIDISEKMIEAARKNTADHNLTNTHFTQTDISDLQMAGNAFDIILAFNLLHLMKDPETMLPKVRDFLQPNGILLSITPCLGTGASLIKPLIKFGSLIGLVPEVQSYKPNRVEKLISNAQFQLIESQIFTDKVPVIFIAAKRNH